MAIKNLKPKSRWLNRNNLIRDFIVLKWSTKIIRAHSASNQLLNFERTNSILVFLSALMIFRYVLIWWRHLESRGSTFPANWSYDWRIQILTLNVICPAEKKWRLISQPYNGNSSNFWFTFSIEKLYKYQESKMKLDEARKFHFWSHLWITHGQLLFHIHPPLRGFHTWFISFQRFLGGQ